MKCLQSILRRLGLPAIFLGLALQLPAATVNVSIGNNFFSPPNVTVNPGDTVTWTQNGFNHNTEAVAGRAEFWRSAILSPGQTFSHTFNTPGTYEYFCQPHASTMRGNVTVRTPVIAPSISQQPESQQVNQGQTATFTVTAGGSTPLNYVWQRNQVNIAGSPNSPTLNVANAQTANEGNYRVIVSNTGGSITSAVATLTVVISAVRPSITAQPEDQTINQGQTANFSVTATGTDPLSYQWFFNDASIPGANQSSLSIANAQSGNSGTYRVTISNSAGSTNSRLASLSVLIPNQPPSVTLTAPTNGVSFASGSDIALSADATDADGSVVLVRFLINQSVINTDNSFPFAFTFSNATANSYTVQAIAQDNGGLSATSAPVSITVTNASSQNISPLVELISPTNGQSFIVGTPIQVRANATDSDGNVLFVEFYLDDNQESSDDQAPYEFTINNLSLGTHTIQAAAVDDRFASGFSLLATITVVESGTPPTITQQPTNQTVNAEDNASFTVVAGGTGPFSYQWQHEGTNLTGAVLSTLTLLDVTPEWAGRYRVIVSNPFGSSPSDEAILTVVPLPTNAPPQVQLQSPTNGAAYTTAQSVLLKASASDNDGTIREVQFLVNDTPVVAVTSAPYEFSTNFPAGTFQITARAIDDDLSSATTPVATITVTQAPVGVAPAITQHPQSQTVNAGLPVNFTVAANGTEPLAYQWQKNEAGIAGANSTTLTIGSAAAGDQGGYRVIVSNASGSVTSQVATLTVNTPEPDEIAPTITVTAPLNNARSSNAPIEFRGTAADNRSVQRVELTIDSNEVVQATGTGNWSAMLTLPPGTHFVAARSFDAAGNASLPVTRRVVVLGRVNVTIVGQGTVSPQVNNRFFEAGRLVRLTAVPRVGNLFAGWSGDLVSSNAGLSFVFRSNVNVTATFVPNPFIAVKGAYSGLFHNPTNIEVYNSGLLSLNLTDRGRFTGKLQSLGGNFPFSGQLNLDGEATFPVIRRGTNPVVVFVKVDLTGSNLLTGTVSGSVSNQEWMAQLGAHRAVRNARTNPAPEAGRYTFYLPEHNEETGDHMASSIATIVIDANGNLTLTGNLADGTPISQRTYIAPNGEWPLYVPVYRGKGAVLGWVQLVSAPTNATLRLFQGLAYWIKPPLGTNDGFTLSTHTQGSTYTPGSLRGQHKFELGGSDFEELRFTINIAANNVVTVVSNTTQGLRMTLNNILGSYRGSFRHPDSGRILQFKGVWVIGDNAGFGYFLNGDSSGFANIDPVMHLEERDEDLPPHIPPNIEVLPPLGPPVANPMEPPLVQPPIVPESTPLVPVTP